jgi:hypothetical protein
MYKSICDISFTTAFIFNFMCICITVALVVYYVNASYISTHIVKEVVDNLYFLIQKLCFIFTKSSNSIYINTRTFQDIFIQIFLIDIFLHLKTLYGCKMSST